MKRTRKGRRMGDQRYREKKEERTKKGKEGGVRKG